MKNMKTPEHHGFDTLSQEKHWQITNFAGF